MVEKMHGWMGSILRVDLTREKISKQPLDKKTAVEFIGGRGFNIRTLFDEVKPRIDPLTPQNVLCLAVGPFTGTSLPLTSRLEVSTLSPYSGILGDGNSGGFFPAELKFAGYDQIIVTGKADRPKYVWIEDDTIELRDADFLWGKSTWETDDTLKADLGRRVRVACIGQAGENLVRSASTISDKYYSAARGTGAVWGSKNLKAIAVRGTRKVQLANPEAFSQLAREDRRFFITDEFQQNVIGKYGTHVGMLHWDPQYRHSEKFLSPDEVPENLKPEGLKKYEMERTGCFGCPLREKDVYEIPSGRYQGAQGALLEYEAIMCIGTNCGIMDPEPIMVMEILCDKYGMC
ncbi:MAG: aldehyde ferredoxin oxidoreductase N-terminal domain-containing protein, partial [Candidatus Hodarchaeota archaeon]